MAAIVWTRRSYRLGDPTTTAMYRLGDRTTMEIVRPRESYRHGDRMATAIVRPRLRVLRLTAGHKYCLLGQLSSEVGWNHYETIKVATIEAYLRANNMFVDYDEMGAIKARKKE